MLVEVDTVATTPNHLLHPRSMNPQLTLTLAKVIIPHLTRRRVNWRGILAIDRTKVAATTVQKGAKGIIMKGVGGEIGEGEIGIDTLPTPTESTRRSAVSRIPMRLKMMQPK